MTQTIIVKLRAFEPQCTYCKIIDKDVRHQTTGFHYDQQCALSMKMCDSY